MQIGALGDIHGEFDTVQLIMQRHADVPLWVCVGDVASNDGEYFAPLAPLYFIKGNNEDFDVLARAIGGDPPAPTLHYMPNGGPHVVGPWRVAALGGTFAPSWYNTPAAALPPSKGRKTVRGVAEARQEPRRQAPSFRARRGAGVQGAARGSICSSRTRRRGRSIPPAAGSTPARRCSTTCWPR